MTELDRFTHDLFTHGGAPHDHAWPIERKRKRHTCGIPRAHDALRRTTEVLSDAAVSLLQETLRDCLIALGTVGAVLEHIGPAATLPVVILVVVAVQYGAHRIGGKS